MATRQLKLKFDVISEWLNLANQRADIPQNWLKIEYQRDAELLYIKFSNSPAAHSKSDLDNEIVFDYDANDKLVGIEVLNLYGIYCSV